MSIQPALELEKTAASKSDILQMIKLFKVSTDNPADKLLGQWKQGQYYLLLGAGHASDKKEKKEFYQKSIESCKKAMLLDAEFAKALQSGSTIWDSAHLLGEEYVDAMGFWYTARCYYFKECLSVIGRLFNIKMMVTNDPVIRRIDELNPNWEGGGNFLSKAIYYIAIPAKFGGSKENAALEFEKAIEIGPKFLVHRWGRAKYLSSITNNKELYVSDLNWVLEQDPSAGGNPHAWNVYFQNQAKVMLAETDQIFK
jgi:tetratricopeptide (TPR) repeat protein